MKLRNETKLQIKAILLIVMISGIIGALYAGLFQYNKPMDILQGTFVGVGVSLSTSVVHTFFLRAWMKRRSFMVAASLDAAFILTAIIAVLSITFIIFEEKGPIAFNFGDIFGSREAYDSIFFTVLMCFSFSFLIQINRLIGGRIFLSLRDL